MIDRNIFKTISMIAFVAVFALTSAAQRSSAPKVEKLLNGMRVLIWNDPSAPNVAVKVRVHSGTAFDPQGKEGVMSLLAESFFPNEGTREFYREDLGGSLEVTANYDYLQVSATSKPDQFLTMLESIAAATATPTIDKETTSKLVARRIEKIKELEKDPSYLADLTAAKRLYGTFPYGRPELGSAESVSTINFADLLEAKQRFLGADNATVAISGNVDAALAYRAARRYFGAWLKSDKIAPSTFKQPESPDTRPLIIPSGTTAGTLVRYALRGVSRNDRLYPASYVLASVLESRLEQNLGELKASNAFVRNEAHVLPGTLFVGMDIASGEAASGNVVSMMLARPVTAEEMAAARSSVLARKTSTEDEDWLDADTYNQSSLAQARKAFENVSLADVQLLAESLSKNPVVTVALTRIETPASN